MLVNNIAKITIIALKIPVVAKTNIFVFSTSKVSLYAFINVNEA